MIGGKRSSRCFEEQMRPKSVEWCSACCGEPIGGGNGEAPMMCARCNGSQVEPQRTFAEAAASYYAMKALYLIGKRLSAEREGDAV